MGKKQQRNAICNCGSGKKYKKCCGFGNPIMANTLTYLGNNIEPKTQFEKEMKEYTGYHPDAYIKPITVKAPIITILIDESNIDNYYSMSAIIYEKNNVGDLKTVNHKLRLLSEDYDVDHFHFTDIFGRNKIFGNRTFEFIKQYSSIVADLNLTPFSICLSKDDICNFQKCDDLSEKEIFISLQWQLMSKVLEYLIWIYGKDLIIHMKREQENITLEKAQLHYLNARDIQERLPFANISIYKYYDIFMKREVFSSSISDLVAYSTSGLKNRISKGISDKKVASEYYKPILLLNECFKELTRIDIPRLDELVISVSRSEKFRLKQMEDK